MASNSRFSIRGTAGALRITIAALLLLAGLHPNALSPLKAVTQYGHDVWQTEDGLPKNAVSSIVQSGDGYLWLATAGGIVRFDGVRFVSQDPQPAPQPQGHSFGHLAQDRDGALWVGLQGAGLACLKDGRTTLYTAANGLSDNTVTALCASSEGALWIGTYGGGVDRFEKGRFTHLGKSEGLANTAVRALATGAEGSLWIGTEGGGLFRYREGSFAHFGRPEGLAGDYVSCILSDRDGGLWMGTRDGLSRFKDGFWTSYHKDDGLSDDMIMCLHQDREGTLWIGTYSGGVNRFLNGAFSAFTSREGLSSDLVLCLNEDREGSLWIGTFGGLDRLRDDKITVYTPREGLADEVAWSACPDGGDGVWIGTRSGLSHFQKGAFTSIKTKDGLPDGLVWSVIRDRSGDLWAGTKAGLCRVHEGRCRTYTTRDGLPSDHVIALFEDRHNALWVGTDGGGLACFQDGRFTTLTTKNGLRNDTVMAFAEDREGGLWICTRKGINLLRDGRLEGWPEVALSVHEDARGTLWFATFGRGLMRFSGGQRTFITVKDGLFDDLLFNVMEDGIGNLWLSSTKGVARVPMADLEAFARDERKTVSCFPLGKADGMRSAECAGGCSPSACRSADGRLWYPTMKGVAVVQPADIRLNPLPPPIRIEEVLVGNRVMPASAGMTVGPTKEDVQFRFTALSFLVPGKVFFKTKLDGYDEKWSDAQTFRSALYGHLPPGRYRFLVKACNNDGVWNETGARLDLRIRPFFYQALWFRLLVLLAILGLGPAYYSLRVRNLKVREVHLVKEVKERTRELDQANRALQERTGELEAANAMLHRLSYLDGLTGIPNRRHFEEVLDVEWRRGLRTRLPLSLMMADIDFFKAFNDGYGHQRGDECLRQVASVLYGGRNRAGDVAARYGGEEFVIIIPATAGPGAVFMADQLRVLVQALAIPHAHSAVAPVVTISMGVASAVPSENASPQDLLAAADRALYRAKQEGRNRVVLDGDNKP